MYGMCPTKPASVIKLFAACRAAPASVQSQVRVTINSERRQPRTLALYYLYTFPKLLKYGSG
jgi:hypothetical protein